ncbi:MAG: CopG family ribbon-helix-helix protein, partial [Alkalispirochaetaceae bacterium]
MSLVRFGVSMEEELVQLLDELASREGYDNRSEALRSLVRKELARNSGPRDEGDVAGIVTLLFPYGRKLVEAPVAAYPSLQITANLQLHLQGNVTLKVLVIQGSASDVHAWTRMVISQRGVLGKLSVIATEDV